MGHRTLIDYYLTAVHQALEDGKEFATTDRCPECDRSIHAVTMDSYHWVGADHLGRNVLIVDCKGRWIINPYLVGIEPDPWDE